MELHDTQLGILNKLLFNTACKYKDLKIDPDIENSTFQFHLDKVIEKRLVKKNDEGLYEITKKGKKIATHIDTENNKMVERRKLSVHLYCVKETSNGPYTLMYTRKKHPFYGNQGFPAGKVLLGEKFPAAAKRELLEETNLSGDPILFNIAHYLVKDNKTKELLDDKVFLDFFIKNPAGDLIESKEGEYKWIPVNELNKYITKPFKDVDTYEIALQRIINFNNVVNFEELEHLTDDF